MKHSPLLDPSESFESVQQAVDYCFACAGDPLENAKAVASYNIDMDEIGFATELLYAVGNDPRRGEMSAAKPTLSAYTVILARTTSEKPWEDTYTAHTWGTSVEDAIGAAIREAAHADGQSVEEVDPDDYAPTVILRGHRQVESFAEDAVVVVQHPHRYEHSCELSFTHKSPREELSLLDAGQILTSVRARIAFLEANPEELLNAVSSVDITDQCEHPRKMSL